MAKKSIIIAMVMIIVLTTVVNASEPIKNQNDNKMLGKSKLMCALSIAGVAVVWAGVITFSGGTAAAAVAVVGLHLGSFMGWIGIGQECF